MSRPVKLTVIIENEAGNEMRFELREIHPDRPLVNFGWNREPVDDPVATERAGGLYRMLRPGPYMSINLDAYGYVVESESPSST